MVAGSGYQELGDELAGRLPSFTFAGERWFTANDETPDAVVVAGETPLATLLEIRGNADFADAPIVVVTHGVYLSPGRWTSKGIHPICERDDVASRCAAELVELCGRLATAS
jgi:hypothetical protein